MRLVNKRVNAFLEPFTEPALTRRKTVKNKLVTESAELRTEYIRGTRKKRV